MSRVVIWNGLPVTLLVLSGLLMACSTADSTAATVRSTTTSVSPVSSATATPTTAQSGLSLLVLGDSIAIPRMGCGSCVGFDEQYRSFLEKATGHTVVLHNEARPNAQIADLQSLLDGDAAIQSRVAAADVIVVSIGYNDGPPWAPDRPCHPKEGKVDTDLLVMLRDFTDQCMQATNESFRGEFDDVYATIEQLSKGRAQLRIDLGNFNNALGNPGGDGTLPPVWAGADAPGFPHADLPKALANMNTAISGYNKVECETATAHGFVCAGLWHAFNGPDGTGSLAAYVNPRDFVHPSVEGQQRIAELLEKVPLGPLA
jgi:lysophospholipase L1-like esterase